MARRFTRFIRPAPRTKIWISFGFGSLTVSASTTRTLGSLNAAALLLRPFTILRSRQVLGIESDQAAVGERMSGIYAAIVANDTAVGLGVTALPDPLLAANSPWFIYQPMMESFVFGDLTGFNSDGIVQYVVDSKAMRKVGTNEDVSVLFAPRSAVGAVITGEGRMLVQLH